MTSCGSFEVTKLSRLRHAVSPLSLARYDGTAGVLVDSHVWIDCIDETSPWNGWASEQLQACSQRCRLHINVVIDAELLIPGPDPESLDALLDVYGTLRNALAMGICIAHSRLFTVWPSRRLQTQASAWLLYRHARRCIQHERTDPRS